MGNISMRASIGYYANRKRFTKVHVVQDGRPICGATISSKLRFQWCAYLYSGVTNSYVECEHCRSKLKHERLM